MPGFQYKDLMITVGSFPRPCLCFAWSFQITYKPGLHAAEALDMFVANIPAAAAGTVNPVQCMYATNNNPLLCTLHTPYQPLNTPVVMSPIHNLYAMGAGPSIGPPPESLATLKAQLRQALDNIERQEAAGAESMQPQTEAEVDELQTKLREAMTELERRKEELRRKPGK